MTTRTLVLTAVLVAGSAGLVMAQTPPQPGQAPLQPAAPTPQPARARTTVEVPLPLPPPAPPAAASRRNGQPINIKVELTLTDQRGGGPAVKRTVSVVVADAHTGQIRSQSDVAGIAGGVPLNVDTSPELLADNKIRLGFSLQYDWAAPVDANGPPSRGTVMKTAMHDSVSLILESGKSMVAAQSADPIGDRQVTVEVKATILR